MASNDVELDALVTRAAAGDTAAQDRLFQCHRERLKRMVSVRIDARLVRRLDASDVVQEVMLAASKRLPEYAANRAIAFYPWLRQIAWDRLVDLHRWHFRDKRSMIREEELQLADDSICVLVDQLVAVKNTPSASIMRREIVSRVRAAMDQLDLVDREILTLRHLEQLSTREAAAVAGISISAAKSRHFRAMQRLLSALDHEGGVHE